MRLFITIILVAASGYAATRWGVAAPEPAPETAAPGPVIAAATPVDEQAQAFILPAAQPAYAPVLDTTLPTPAPDANAALVYNLGTETILYSKNDTVRAPIASLTKVLTALVVHDLFAVNDVVTVASSAVRVDGIRQTLFAGERIRVGDLMTLMLVESSNDAAYALAAHASSQGIDLVGRMNDRAESLGMVHSLFTDPAGLDDTAYATVKDLIRLVKEAVRYPGLWTVMREPEVTVSSADGVIQHVAKNTNALLDDFPGIIWGKTGNTDGALGCMLLIVEIPEKNDIIVSAVLGSRSRFSDTRLLVDWVQQAWR
ncbi:MAG TPA: serine hydrolase [Candidatus Paceibacterota bacterium]|nr:serine hydrolase [Candidatus Paceibacterota bacterium]